MSANRYPGTCATCHTRVPAGQGYYTGVRIIGPDSPVMGARGGATKLPRRWACARRLNLL
jgi:hypothetical protein